MKARILEQQVKVYSSTDANAVSFATLPEGSEIEFSAARRKGGKLWIPITLSTGQQAFIPGDTRLFVMRQGSLLQNDVQLHAEPSAESPIKQQLSRNTTLDILQVVKGEGEGWVLVRDSNGREGYISGNTRIRVIQQRTKAMGRKNILTGIMWLIAGIVITFTGGSPASGSSFYYLGYAAILFGAVLVVWGVVQYLRAPA